MNRRKTDPYRPSAMFWRLVFAAALLGVALAEVRAGQPLTAALPCPQVAEACGCAETDSWIFRPSRYTHDPDTGFRVAQYDRLPAIEPLDDPRLVTSGYSRQRAVLQGPDGSVSTSYRVQSYGSGNGAFDAQAERWHDAARGAFGAGIGFIPPPFYGAGGGWGPWPGPWGPGGGWGGGWGGGGDNTWGPRPGYAWGNGPRNGREGGPAYSTPYGPVDGDAAEGVETRAWRTPDREFYRRDRELERLRTAPAPEPAPPAE